MTELDDLGRQTASILNQMKGITSSGKSEAAARQLLEKAAELKNIHEQLERLPDE